jgi:hypothetical protein
MSRRWHKDAALREAAIGVLSSLFKPMGFTGPHATGTLLSYFLPAKYEAESGVMLRTPYFHTLDLADFCTPEAAVEEARGYLSTIPALPNKKET